MSDVEIRNEAANRREHVRWLLSGLAGLFVFVVIVAAATLPAFLSAEHNRQKVEHLTTVCVDHGYRGWQDKGIPGCYR